MESLPLRRKEISLVLLIFIFLCTIAVIFTVILVCNNAFAKSETNSITQNAEQNKTINKPKNTVKNLSNFSTISSDNNVSNTSHDDDTYNENMEYSQQSEIIVEQIMNSIN